jgi:wyosine [tRNA(Phe)-imidazoG37] synthetase (radical SAM superfamily)
MTGYQYVYGPVPSWRLGRSLGIDPISRPEKVCSFDCVYCQIGATDRLQTVRESFVTQLQIVCELRKLPRVDLDYVTFSGRGEPALARNLGGLIRAVKMVRSDPVAVITNSSLLADQAVRVDLGEADLVVAKLDACTEEMFRHVNRPAAGISLEKVVKGLAAFSAAHPGTLALQVMLFADNLHEAEGIAALAREIAPSEVQINTPLRLCPQNTWMRPLDPDQLQQAAGLFSGKVRSVYQAKKKAVHTVSGTDTLARRGKTLH